MKDKPYRDRIWSMKNNENKSLQILQIGVILNGKQIVEVKTPLLLIIFLLIV